MPHLSRDPEGADPARRRITGALWLPTAVLVLGLVAAWMFDGWYRQHLIREERVRVARAMAAPAAALSTAVGRRAALLEGLHSFAAAQPTRGALNSEFPTFAQGIVLGTTGVRALQFVEGGRIVATWPIVGNERALGYNLLEAPQPEIRADVRRALATGDVTVTGPIPLVQGGDGLLVRRRLSGRPGFPELATIVLDVPAVIREAGIPSPVTGLHLEVRDRELHWFGGDPEGTAIEPETVSVSIPDGDWQLLASPTLGWHAAIAEPLAASRAASAAIVLALVLLGVLGGLRQARLSRQADDWRTQLSVALKAGGMGSWDWDIVNNRTVFSAAAAALLGRPREEVSGPGERFMSFVHPDDLNFVTRCLDEVVHSDRMDYLLEYRVAMPDGSARWVLAMGAFERTPDGRAVRARGVISDATDRRALEAKVRHTERLETMGTLAGGVAHDFNNLLTAMVNFAQFADEQLAESGSSPAIDGARADIKEMLRVAERATGLTGQILSFSRRSTTAEPKRVDIAKAICELEPMLRRLLPFEIRLELELSPDPLPVWIDPGQFTQVLLNLVVNARDAIETEGRVLIRAERCGAARAASFGIGTPAWIVVEVEDSGRGMTEDTKQRIFEPYFTTKETAHGTGLGLAVLMGVVKSAGGDVRVWSEAGKGSRFSILLPPHAG